jgi:uncharacterized protein YbaR (Trm112 family)
MMSTVTSLLKCPVSGSDLALLDETALKELRGQIEGGRRRHLAGEPVQMQVESAMSSSDGHFVYPIVDGIMIFIPSLAIVPAEFDHSAACHQLAPETASVMRFYDELGWHQTKNGMFEDGARFEDLRPVSSDYIHQCHMRVSPAGRSKVPHLGPVQNASPGSGGTMDDYAF